MRPRVNRIWPGTAPPRSSRTQVPARVELAAIGSSGSTRGHDVTELMRVRPVPARGARACHQSNCSLLKEFPQCRPPQGVTRVEFWYFGVLKSTAPDRAGRETPQPVPPGLEPVGTSGGFDKVPASESPPELLTRHAARSRAHGAGNKPEQQHRRPFDCSRRHTCHVRVPALSGDGVEAAEVQKQAVAAAYTELVQPGDIALYESQRDLCGCSPLAGPAERASHQVDSCRLPAVLGHVDHVGTGTAAQVERPAWRQGLRALDQRGQLGWWDARVPGLEPDQVSELPPETHPLILSQPPGSAPNDCRSGLPDAAGEGTSQTSSPRR